PRCVHNWEAGRHAIPFAAFKLLRIWCRYELPGVFSDAQRGISMVTIWDHRSPILKWKSMAIERLTLSSAALLIALAMAGCGGSDSDQAASPDPVTSPQSFKLELLSGSASVDMDRCESVNGAAASARFSRLLRATAYKDAIYLMETGEGCTNVDFDARRFVPSNIRPAIRKLSDSVVETAVELNDYITVMSHPVMVRYPSGFFRSEDSKGGFVLGYVAANSDWGFALDSAEVARYTEQGGWDFYVPGLFKLTDVRAGYDDLVAGTLGGPPASADGKGHAAGFVAPHDLEKDAAGVFYVIDDGRIRTIDAEYQVKTLDHAALGITGAVKALDSDPQGKIHVLVQREGPSYTWHRLSDGSKLDFQTRQFVMTEPSTVETFTIIGDELLLGIRLPSGSTSLYRVASNGEVKELSGTKAPETPQDFLDQPSQAVQHIEYGPDGHLYIVLPQGVLIARDYT
ncbi:hypothetical protein, partial [Ottowia sp.]|uniref:hypothetical protein n=1 Tax=Ottowia sp. TaxID=1898956 RepID=UPI0039E57AB1